MEIEKARKIQTINFVILIITLAAIAAGLAVLIGLTTRAAAAVDDAQAQRLLARLAWVSVALLALTLIVLLWMVMRFVRRRFRPPGRSCTPYVDAWALAGQRFKLEENPLDEDDDEDDANQQNGQD